MRATACKGQYSLMRKVSLVLNCFYELVKITWIRCLELRKMGEKSSYIWSEMFGTKLKLNSSDTEKTS